MVILMTIGACVVGGGGWVAAAMVNSGDLPADTKPGQAFYVATELLSTPGMFGLILAALTAALMSTVDTLITAISAVVVNDVYKVHIKPDATDEQLLKTARITAVAVTMLGVLLVPCFMMFDSIYDAHGAFTAAVTPPLVVALLLSVFWRRFTATAALCTMIFGLLAIGLSMIFPIIITPFAHGVPMGESGDGLLAGMKQFKFMRACYGVSVCFAIGVGVTLFTKPESFARQKGLVWGTIKDALKNFKGTDGAELPSQKSLASVAMVDEERTSQSAVQLPVVRVAQSLAAKINIQQGDLLHVSDRRWWLGGLCSAQCVVGEVFESDSNQDKIELGPKLYRQIVSPKRRDQLVVIERLY